MAKYTYTIFDASPQSSSGTEWPSHQDIELEADSDDEAITEVRDVMSIEASGLNPSDGYEVGEHIHAIVWSEDGTIVGQPTYELTHEDLGVPTEEEIFAERVARAAKHIDATKLDDGRWAHYDDAMGHYYVVSEEELADLCGYLDNDEEQGVTAYSAWCAGTSAEEKPKGWDPDVDAATVAKWIEGVSFQTPPENQGQTVLVSYGCDADYIYERTYDQSDRSTIVCVYEHTGAEDDEFDPWNKVPSTGDLIYTVELS